MALDCSPREQDARNRHTGRYLVVFRSGSVTENMALLRRAAGLRLAGSSDFGAACHGFEPACGEGVVLESLGTALVRVDEPQARRLTLATRCRAFEFMPERYLRGEQVANFERPAGAYGDTAFETWGLTATGVLSSRFSGRGVRVAVLDSGIDAEHPDFAGRCVAMQSFTARPDVADASGHGTFCAGVVAGPQQPRDAPRYGAACGAQLFVAKVLEDDAEGRDGSVLAGIDWAVRNECAVISLSLGTPVYVGDTYSQVYEQAAARALAAGSILIAPAGNASERPDTVAPVDRPANCPSVVSVGALGPDLTVAAFSNGGLNENGGEINITAPGIGIVSAVPRPALYQAGSGTSTAASLVAGIAALFAEAYPGERGDALRARLLGSARQLPYPVRDVGAGLVQAPQ